MIKILIVDDEMDLEILIRQKFQEKIREQQFGFIFAVNGNDALSKMQENPDVEIVLSDINMPGMDGLTLLSKISETNTLVTLQANRTCHTETQSNRGNVVRSA